MKCWVLWDQNGPWEWKAMARLLSLRDAPLFLTLSLSLRLAGPSWHTLPTSPQSDAINGLLNRFGTSPFCAVRVFSAARGSVIGFVKKPISLCCVDGIKKGGCFHLGEGCISFQPIYSVFLSVVIIWWFILLSGDGFDRLCLFKITPRKLRVGHSSEKTNRRFF